MSFAIVAAKVADPAFRARFTVAVTEQCRFMLGEAQGARSLNRYNWDLALARGLLFELATSVNVDRMARLTLLPATWGAFDPDNDTQLQARVGSYMPLFASTAPPA